MITVACITTSRADWATIGEVARALRDAGATVSLLVAAEHTGIETIRREWGEVFTIYGPILQVPEMGNEVRNLLAASGFALADLGTLLAAVQPGAVLVAGDRHEALQAAFCAAFCGFRVAHVAGGDVTGGSLDERWRHAITKIADIHFPTTASAGRRIEQMGEEFSAIFPLGSPSIDKLVRTPIMPRAEVCKALELPDARDFWVINWQPGIDSDIELPPLLNALDRFTVPAVIVGVGADPGRGLAVQLLASFALDRTKRGVVTRTFSDLAPEVYLSALAHCRALIGNSSSGYYEAPFYGTQVIDVGTRQEGRSRRIVCIKRVGADAEVIADVIRRLPASRVPEYPFGQGGAAVRIAKAILENAGKPAKKRFVLR